MKHAEDNMLCRDVMNRPVETVRSSETVQAAAQRMRDSNVGFLAVCDDAGRMVGVVTDRDITVRLCAAGGLPAETPISEVMTADVVRCATTDDLRMAERLMIRDRKSRIVITDDRDRLAGVISLSDVASRAPADAVDVLRRVASREIAGPDGRPRTDRAA